MEFTLELLIEEAKKELLELRKVKKLTNSDYEKLGFAISLFKRLENLRLLENAKG